MSVVFYLGAAPLLGVGVLFPPMSVSSDFMESTGIQAAVVVTTMEDIAGCAYEADTPVLDGRGGLSSPRGLLVSNLCCLAMFIQPDVSPSVSRCSEHALYVFYVDTYLPPTVR